MRIARRLLVLALFVGALVIGWRFAGLNASAVTVDYLLGEVSDVSLWAALLGAFGLGAALAGTIGGYQLAKLQLVARRYRKKVRGLESEVHQLRNLPLAAGDTTLHDSPTGADPPPRLDAMRGE